MHDESGETMEPTEEVPHIGLGESELKCVVNGERIKKRVLTPLR